MTKLRRTGIELQGAKNATIVADALGDSFPTADRHRREAGATLIDYIDNRDAVGIRICCG